jgi:hypothetical protein
VFIGKTNEPETHPKPKPSGGRERVRERGRRGEERLGEAGRGCHPYGAE